ncbi:hypothetical protein BD289DRAFT_427129 [Coniella lustricola]|uniref:Uncharacterized protein n=1 Tax=Coniella lustricola TaxID=2025994 RepID=A0A2T3AFN9_9PEZI|nr:hypothetical protein BD289DRAFT_427129 [Coniella lustricola]
MHPPAFLHSPSSDSIGERDEDLLPILPRPIPGIGARDGNLLPILPHPAPGINITNEDNGNDKDNLKPTKVLQQRGTTPLPTSIYYGMITMKYACNIASGVIPPTCPNANPYELFNMTRLAFGGEADDAFTLPTTLLVRNNVTQTPYCQSVGHYGNSQIMACNEVSETLSDFAFLALYSL